MKKQKSKKRSNKFDIYESREDAYLSGYSDATDEVLQLLITYMAFSDDFLLMFLREFVKKNKKEWDKIL